MRIRGEKRRRSGVVIAEAAIVLPVLFVVILGITLLGLGVFRYQQVAMIAREAARWTSVHGGQYALETGHAKASATTIYNSVMKPFATALDTSQMAFSSNGGSGSALSFTVSWLDASQMPTFKDSSGNEVINRVTIAITYNWIPEGLIGPITFKSTSVMPMSY